MISTPRLCMTACIIGIIEEVRNNRKRSGNSNPRYARKRLVNRSDQMLRRPRSTGRENGAVVLWNHVRCQPKTSLWRATPMPVFHAPAHCTNHDERGGRALARLVEQVNALRACPLSGEDFANCVPCLPSQARSGGRDAGALGRGLAISTSEYD